MSRDSLFLALILGLFSAAPLAPQSGPDARRVEVRVEGVGGELHAAVTAGLRIAREARVGRALTEGEVTLLHGQAPDQIRLALEPFGHYRPEIEASLTQDGSTWRAAYRVRPGPVVAIGSIDFEVTGEGGEDPAFVSVLASLRPTPGQPFRHSGWEQGKRRLQAAAVERGYLDAAFADSRVLVHALEDRADGILRFDTGPRFHFGPVRFRGDKLEEDFLGGFVPFSTGAPVSTPTLLELQNALQATGLFASVEVALLRDEAVERAVPVEVRLVPRPRYRYDAGLGYGTDTGPRAVLGAELRRLNPSGHGIEAELRASFIRNGLTARYLIPLPGRAGDRVGIAAGILDERTQDVQSTRASLGLGWHRSRGRWREAWLLDLQRERSGEGGEVRTSYVVLPSVQWTRTDVDDAIHPRRARWLRLEVAGTHEALAAPATFGRIAMSAGTIFGPWTNGRILLRAEAGTTFVGDPLDLPVSQRFYAGGDRSVRGYAYRTLSPKDEEGLPLGGRHLLAGSLEIEQLFWRGFGLALFVDGGNAGYTWPVSPSVGTGVGLRWLSPVGIVGLDAAAAVSEPGTPWRIHLSIGSGS